MNRTYWMKHIFELCSPTRRLSRQENITYLVVWGLLYAAPLLSLYIRTISDESIAFDWTEIFIVWRKFTIFLLLFLVHNFLLAPLLIHGHRRKTYFAIVTVVMAAFILYQCSSQPEFKEPREHRPPPRSEMTDHHHPPMDEPRPLEFRRKAPPPIVGERDILAVVVLILMFGANLGIKGYFRSRDDHRRLAELKKQNLEQQLEYLRYQINPHFFMNTLNNIHALVDIDPTKAQETIVELSKMMRYILYEGEKRGVPLTKEMEFIRTYVKLMKLRYTDNVLITLNLPDEVPDRTIPPLILISFIENAFKHGVSYQHESFIGIKVSTEDDKLFFSCRNSKTDKHAVNPTQPSEGGVGLANVRKRLGLLYEHRYSLSIHDDADVYTVDLIIPL